MTALTPSVPSRSAGADLSSLTAAGGSGDTFAPGNDVYLFVKSTNTGAVTVTVGMASGEGPSGTTITDYALAPDVDADTGERLYGPLPASPFSQTSDGQVHVTYSSSDNVGVKVLKLS